MELIRKRFMTPRPSNRTLAVPETDDQQHQSEPAKVSQPRERDSNVLVLHLSPSKRIVMSADGSVTLLDRLAATVVSTSENQETKILALESIHDVLGQNDERNLNPNRESPMVAQIIRTFKSKEECLDAIHRCCFVAEHRRALTNWTNDIWEEDAEGTAPKDAEEDPDSPAGSLFSDSDVQEIPNNRVRPITLRPRRPVKHEMPVKIKSEFKSDNHSSSSAPTKSSSVITSPLLPRSRQSSPHPERERSPQRLDQGSTRPTLKSRTLSAPTLRHKASKISLRHEFPEPAKKRPHLTSENIPPEDRNVKRVKSHDVLPVAKSRATPSTKKALITTKRSAEKVSLSEVLSGVATNKDTSGAAARESNAAYVARYWKATSSQFPEPVRTLSAIDRLAYYFRETDLMRRELEIVKRDEAERRKSMLLTAEKIKLMNQPVARGVA